MTGGLGPTPDDLTRKAVATALNRPLQLEESVLAHIRERGRRMGRKLPSSVETMALVPRGSEVWQNSVGAAPGILIDYRKKPVILLPGPPQELEALADEHVIPWLRERSGAVVESFTLRTYGLFESQLHERIGQLPDHWPGATLAYLPSWFGVDLRVTVTGGSANMVRQSAERAYHELGERVAGVIYAEGTQTMEEAAAEVLLERRLAHRAGGVVHGRAAVQAAHRRLGLVSLRRTRLRDLLQRRQGATARCFRRGHHGARRGERSGGRADGARCSRARGRGRGARRDGHRRPGGRQRAEARGHGLHRGQLAAG
jgi:molybdopterin-biosynthesis enzyme MoeA-like protein